MFFAGLGFQESFTELAVMSDAANCSTAAGGTVNGVLPSKFLSSGCSCISVAGPRIRAIAASDFPSARIFSR